MLQSRRNSETLRILDTLKRRGAPAAGNTTLVSGMSGDDEMASPLLGEPAGGAEPMAGSDVNTERDTESGGEGLLATRRLRRRRRPRPATKFLTEETE